MYIQYISALKRNISPEKGEEFWNSNWKGKQFSLSYSNIVSIYANGEIGKNEFEFIAQRSAT